MINVEQVLKGIEGRFFTTKASNKRFCKALPGGMHFVLLTAAQCFSAMSVLIDLKVCIYHLATTVEQKAVGYVVFKLILPNSISEIGIKWVCNMACCFGITCVSEELGRLQHLLCVHSRFVIVHFRGDDMDNSSGAAPDGPGSAVQTINIFLLQSDDTLIHILQNVVLWTESSDYSLYLRLNTALFYIL